MLGLALSTACAGGAGVLRPSPGLEKAERCAPGADPLVCFSPVILQETSGDGAWDRPSLLDFDGSGRLDDDVLALKTRSAPPATLYGERLEGPGGRLFLFYGLYYPVDWSRGSAHPKIDHVGDFEGALVIANSSGLTVEAVVTQAHRRFYLWSARATGSDHPSVSGVLAFDGTHPVLFSESGGHGLYAHGHGAFRPAGGNRYGLGPAGVPSSRVTRLVFDASTLRPISELRRFCTGDNGAFVGLPRGARPPWLWDDARGGPLARPGLIWSDPATLLKLLRSRRRP